MMENIIDFHISDNEKLAIYLPCIVNEIYRYDEVKIIFSSKNNDYILYDNDFIIEAIDTFSSLLKKAISNGIEINEPLSEKGLGYILNEYYQDRVKINKGDRFSLWESKDYHTWIYNKENEIYMEITPIYKWHFREVEEQDDFVSYDEFAKNYHTIIVCLIKRENAKKWLKICENILKFIMANDEEKS